MTLPFKYTQDMDFQSLWFTYAMMYCVYIMPFLYLTHLFNLSLDYLSFHVTDTNILEYNLIMLHKINLIKLHCHIQHKPNDRCRSPCNHAPT